MKSQWITPDSLPSGNYACFRVVLPDDFDYLALFKGAILPLTYAQSWEQVLGITPEQASSVFLEMYDGITFETDRTCRMIGEIILWSTDTSPNSNWLLCDGSSLLRANFPDLFAVIGTTYGASDVSHFNLPDMRGNVPIGQDGSTYVVGNTLGEVSHTLVTSEIPSHTHTDIGHVHTEITATPSIGAAITGVPIPSAIPGVGVTGSSNASLTNTGGDGSHNNIQPSLVLSYLIVAK